MNRTFPSFFATSRTRSSPFGPFSRLCVRHWLDCSLAFVRLLFRYYAAVRLPDVVHEGLTAHRVLPPSRLLPAGDNGASRFSSMEFLCMRGVFDSAGPRRTRVGVRLVVAFLTV